MSDGFYELEDQVDEYITCLDNINTIRSTSNEMTNLVEKVFGNVTIDYVYSYFELYDDGSVYENALTEIGRYHQDDEICQKVEEAASLSAGLKNMECYIMKLVISAKGKLNDAVWPADITNAQLFYSDIIKESDAKMERASEMLFGDYYQTIREDTRRCLDEAQELIEARYMKQQRISVASLGEHVSRQRMLMYGMLLFNILLFVFITYFIVRPFRKVLKAFQEDKPLSADGAYEFYILADTYNELYRANMKQKMLLTERAYLDMHTGLPNKSRCEEILKSSKSSRENTCCIMIDLNNLKVVNDKSGHMEGDILIRSFAAILRKVFREQDFVGRYGGDEFVAVLQDVKDESVRLIAGRIEDEVNLYNRRVRMGLEEGREQISYAYGYAISENIISCSMEELLEAADANMYENKRNYKQHLKEQKNKKPQILVVNSSEQTSTDLCALLNRAGFSAEAVCDSEEMLCRIDNMRPDIVMMDFSMPVMKGIDATGLLQKQYPEIKVIACSDSDDPADRRLAFEKGADNIIIKPFEAASLTEAIAKVFYI